MKKTIRPPSRIGEQQGGSGALDAGGRSQKQPGANGAADGDELEMPRGEAAPDPGPMGIRGVSRVVGSLSQARP